MMENNIAHSFMRHQQHSNPISNHDSATSSPGSGQGLIPPPSSYYTSAPASRTPTTAESPANPNRSPGNYSAEYNKYHPSYGNSSGSPSSVTGSLHESMPSNDHYGSAGISPTHLSGQALSAQKRAYRQRRKDPSCDACRERKVKCDATETSSCSECISRTVKCQFTKETNRRMSSIKQVQDLQNQLNETKQQLTKLRSLLNSPNGHESSPETQPLNLPALGHRIERGQEPSPLPHFAKVREDLRKYSRGIFKLPPKYRPIAPTPVMNSAEITLPPRRITDTLLSQFYSHFHAHMPFIHWKAFSERVEQAYSKGTLGGLPQIWAGVFFGVLACGSLQQNTTEDGLNPDVDGMKYIVIATRLLNTWTDNLLIDHARVTLMISIFLTEQNIRSAGWIWLGSAVRISQDIGLHLETGPWPKQDGDARKRVYWAIFAWDRILSLDGRPLQVYEEDYEVPWPNQAENDREGMRSPISHHGLSAMSIIIPVIRFVPQLKKTLKARTISRQTLQTYEDYFQSIMSSYPEHVQIGSDGYLDPYLLRAVFPLQAARIMLYRHNLTPQCGVDERNEAVNKCFGVALDTLKYIERTMRTPPPDSDQSPGSGKWSQEAFRNLIQGQADNFICKHIWRTTLILCIKGDYSNALTCIRLSATIDNIRKVNVACGRNISHFLDRLTTKVTSGAVSPYQLEADEEMIAYLAGDLQGDPENAWIWAEPEAEREHATTGGTTTNQEILPSSALLTATELTDWGGWDRVEKLLLDLIAEQQRQNRPQHPYHQPAHNSTKRLQLSPSQISSSPHLPAAAPPVGASRISIANII